MMRTKEILDKLNDEQIKPVLQTEGAVLVLAVSGYEPQIEKRVRRVQEVAWSMKMPPRIVVVDCGMDDATRRAAEELSAWDTTFTLCRAEELKHILEELTNQETKHACRNWL